jgi:hypothetical protein
MIFLKNKNFSNLCFLVASILFFSSSAQATIFFKFDAENEPVGSILPLRAGSYANFCQTECGTPAEYEKGTVQDAGGAPQGSKYFQWRTINLQHDALNEIQSDTMPDSNGWPITLEKNKSYYLAYYMRFDRMSGLDIWHEGTDVQSGDKGVELYGPDVRLLTSRGQWDHMSANQDHHFTVWGGIMRGDNPDLVWGQNSSGYNPTNPIQLTYETWHPVIMEFKLSCNNQGHLAVYINGVKTEEYLNVNTLAPNCSPVVSMIHMGGTFAQPAYDSPAHFRKFDALILTDNWQDIVDGGYLAEASSPPAPESITIPAGFKLQ